MFDVIEVQFKKPRTVRLIAEGKSERNADAIINMAVMRRGVEEAFFTTAPAGKYKDGDELQDDQE